MARRPFDVDALTGPSTLRAHFTPTGRIRKASGGTGRDGVGIAANADGTISLWAVGPLGWWHDFQTIPAGTSFDAALSLTHLPRFYGWAERVAYDPTIAPHPLRIITPPECLC